LTTSKEGLKTFNIHLETTRINSGFGCSIYHNQKWSRRLFFPKHRAYTL